MKVLHMISGGDKGGAKTSVFALLLALSEEIDITVACFTEGVFYQEVLEMPVKSVLFKQKFRNDLSVIGRLKKYVRQGAFDIIHAHGARANFISMMLKPFVAVPVITTVHSDYKLDFTDSIFKRVFYTGLNSIALRTLDYYIGVSEEFRRMLIGRGFDESRVFSVYNAIDFKREINFCEKEEFLRRFNIDAQGKTLVGIIGRFDYVKGHDVFLRGAAEVLKKRDDFLFLMAGEGTEEPALRKLADSLGISKNVIFTGFVNDIFSFINAIDINVCASRSESFPFMLLEGTLLKKPTVSTEVGGIPELIKNGETGFLVPSGDFEGLAEKIIFYAENPETSASHGENLFLYAKANFSKESLQAKSIEIYNEVLRKEKAANRVFDIMLSGYYGYANSGDDALLDAVIKSLRKEREGLSILVLSRNPQETMRDYGVFSIHRLNFFRVRRYMKKTRLIVYGGGSHMQDNTSTRSLVYYTFLIHLAKFMGMRVMLYGNGIGPLSKARNVEKARRALNACDYISLRDPESFDFIKQIGVENPNVALSIDPVFSLEPQEISLAEIGMDFDTESGGCFIISLRPWQHNEPNFIEKMAEVINYASEKYSLTPILIPLQMMDVAILRETAKRLTCAHILHTRVYDYKTIMAIISRAEFAICMRLHALIYAVGVGLPIIGLVYDPKVANFISYMNETAQVSTSAPNVSALKTMIDEIKQNPAAAKEKIAAERERLRKLSDHDAKVAVGLLE
ncbi:MAG: polysaccharide pyruvyl transferase CsaB [Defluviitaleaceae bacterium]|nr:polysaccharide pyruvyl transferase CsaB [Defluviitaleaceae bacterium]MCL2263073.1 polysaccharide pyruvyl transferase CsaB [Defluviitaleaceae bacterium]